jgi:hypothetical protein
LACACSAGSSSGKDNSFTYKNNPNADMSMLEDLFGKKRTTRKKASGAAKRKPTAKKKTTMKKKSTTRKRTTAGKSTTSKSVTAKKTTIRKRIVTVGGKRITMSWKA